jgi:Rieske Fe-S protein
MSCFLPRRWWLTRCLAVLGLGGSALPTSAAETAYRELKQPVSVLLSAVEKPWQSAGFSAWARKPATADADASDLLLKGVLLRVRKPVEDDVGLRAFSLHCPHELCYVQLVEETEAVRIESGPKPENPVLVCPCHFSVFDPRERGRLLTGPAGRGLYRFRFEVRDNVVEIQEVEEAALG